MCGIAAIAGGRVAPQELEAMAAEMAHRGPDGQAVWTGEGCGLGFRRLAIIDLQERSMQPLALDGHHLVFNGEIYDYRERRAELEGRGHTFVTEGDGEVLLHAWREWGEGALDRLNGMFAFAVWDEATRRLTAAGDAFGEKPLYWAQADGRLLLASDIRAILAVAPELSSPRSEALAPYLALGLGPGIEHSFFAGIHRLPGGHVLRRDATGRVDVARWLELRRVDAPGDPGEAAEAVRALLTDSIRLRLRADVPVGTSLSGGVDSSAIVGLSAAIAGDHRRHAFTATFPGDPRDEWRYAAEVAQAAGVVEHHAVTPTGADLLGELDALVRGQEEPVVSSSVYAQWRVSRAAREAGVTVLLDGQGADELFGGYAGIDGWARRSEGARAMAGGGRDVLAALGAEHAPRVLARRWRAGLASPYAAVGAVAAAVRIDPPRVAGRTPLERELRRQTLHTSLPLLLRFADRSSMAHAREVRLPFLDRRLAELALSLPAGVLWRDGVRKAVLRDAVRGVVPDAVLDRRDKVGFETPQAAWLREPAFVARISDALLDPAARTRELLDVEAVRADAKAGAWRSPDGIWRALNLELWLRTFEAGA